MAEKIKISGMLTRRNEIENSYLLENLAQRKEQQYGYLRNVQQILYFILINIYIYSDNENFIVQDNIY